MAGIRTVSVDLTPTEAIRLSHDWIADGNFFHLLDAEDARVAAAVKAAGCPDCGGRLDQADYPRKPRGGDLGVAGEIFERRRSLCCARDGCRHRRTPTSLVFLGRRVYLGVVVVMATLRSGMAATGRSPGPRTVRRWRAWFAGLRGSAWWGEVAGQLWPPLGPEEVLPDAMVDRLVEGRCLADALTVMLRRLSPLSITRVR